MIPLCSKNRLTLSFILILSFFVFAPRNNGSRNELNRGLLALCSFEENIPDLSANDNPSILAGTEKYVQRKFGKAPELDGRFYRK